MAHHICIADGCTRSTRGNRKHCHAHAQRIATKGDALTDIPIRKIRPAGLPVEATFRYFVSDNPMPESGCWIWPGRVNDAGYGVFECGGRKNRTRHRAHVVSYEIHIGKVIPGLVVRHECDNPPCVRPDHLLLGTQLENIQDTVSRNRQSKGLHHGDKYRGERHPRAKLTDADVLTIRKMANQISRTEIASHFNVSVSTIARVVQHRAWTHV